MFTSTDHSEEQATTLPTVTDEELMQSIIGREQSALDQLYARYRPLISKIVMEILPNEDQAGASDLRRFLTNIIGSLPAEQGKVIHLSYFKEMSQREIASRTGIPLGTIKTRLDLALRKLAQKSMPFRKELFYTN